MEALAIGDVARRAGIRPSAIRYYERVGILPPPTRRNGRRRYGADVLRRLAVVRLAKEAGFTVAEMRTLFHGFADGTAASVRWRGLAERKLGEVEALVARAEAMRRVLQESLRCGCRSLDACAWVAERGQCGEPAAR